MSRDFAADLSRKWPEIFILIAGDRLWRSFCDPECSSLANKTDIRNSGVVHAVPLVLADVSVSFEDTCFVTGVRSTDLLHKKFAKPQINCETKNVARYV